MTAFLEENPQAMIRLESSQILEFLPFNILSDTKEVVYFRHNVKYDELFELEHWYKVKGYQNQVVKKVLKQVQNQCDQFLDFLEEHTWYHFRHSDAPLMGTWLIDAKNEEFEDIYWTTNGVVSGYWNIVCHLAKEELGNLTQSQSLLLGELTRTCFGKFSYVTMSQKALEHLWIENMVYSKAHMFRRFFDKDMPSKLVFLRDKQVIEAVDGTPIGSDPLTKQESTKIETLPVFVARRMAKNILGDGVRKGLTFPALSKCGQGIKYLFMLDVPLYLLNDLSNNSKWPLLVSLFNRMEFFDTASLYQYLHNLGTYGVPKFTANEAVAQILWILKKTFPDVFVGERLDKVLFD